MALPLLTVSARPGEVEVVEEVCGATGCGTTGLLPIVALLAATLLVVTLLAAAALHLGRARSLVVEERERAAKERDAFDAFGDRVTAIEASPVQSIDSGGVLAAVTAHPPDGQLERVRDAYRDTVMSVPHYDEEYNESLGDNMAAEFGEELAVAVTDGSRFTPRIKHSLVQGSDEAKRRRDELVSALDREIENFDDATERFDEIEREVGPTSDPALRRRPFSDLLDQWDRLDDLEERCESLLEARQKQIQYGSAPELRGADPAVLQEYLYHPLPTDYPVLSRGTDVLERIRSARSSVLTAISRRA